MTKWSKKMYRPIGKVHVRTQTSPVYVSYRCPVCAMGHSKAEHERLAKGKP